ncbi:hypothetical protein [Dinoroseobacter shibae]|uniref:hypothetical protein n=1 Tax=Dinoroseobacter shibae TaxID=215813 RepID=UPI0000E99DDA|nr:hypothetical protein [Dinoroseobacter shibae]URF47645.1 hypothetical protein M8008_04990 [Dinoroseobacter shibae]URF51955.1 hypothetical protein M8007_04990 [Dinoroseobacter shibae]
MFSRAPISGLSDLERTKVAGAGMNLRYLEGIEGCAVAAQPGTEMRNAYMKKLVEAGFTPVRD